MSTASNHHSKIKVAIIGGSYAGLSLANALHINSIKYTIYDRRTFPFNHVMGGTVFNIPSFSLIYDRLELDNCHRVVEKITRKDVSDSLLQRVKKNLTAGSNIIEIITDGPSFYLLVETKSRTSMRAKRKQHGPYQIIVGADGVLSKCRESSHEGIFLVGDARWVNDRWYDLGLKRINRGADIAMVDGMTLGESIAKKIKCSMNALEIIQLINGETNYIFCAKEGYRKKLMRHLAISVLVFVFIVMHVFVRNDVKLV